MRRHLFHFALCALGLAQPLTLLADDRRARSSVTASVNEGRIRGALGVDGGAVFKGIPYARPPIGDLRWREPRPPTQWHGVLDATKFKPVCSQGPALAPKGATIAEDCLYLNVWAPEWPPKAQNAVMVWITGGGNFGGGIAESKPDADGASLAKQGVVLVSLNYRLGTFGFFAHPELTRESPHHASGNQGILDQLAALHWVQKNIAAFGGDPNNVTIFGESAGSHDVSVLMTTQLSKGLFNRVIGESGSVVLGDNPQSLHEAELRGARLAAQWGSATPTSLAGLRQVSADTILKTDPDLIETVDAPGPSFPNLGIVVDGYVFKDSPIKVFLAGKESAADLLHGSNSRDGIPGPTYDGPQDLDAAIRQAYGPLAERAKVLYAAGADLLYGTQANQWSADTSFRCPAVAQVSWHSNAGHRAYQYEFAYVSPQNGPRAAGALHASEIAYVFGASLVESNALNATTGMDREMSQLMQAYWTNFAKTGDPNGGQLPKWPAYNLETREFMQFNANGAMVSRELRKPQCDMFMENVKRLNSN